jgi:hypothetical protein
MSQFLFYMGEAERAREIWTEKERTEEKSAGEMEGVRDRATGDSEKRGEGGKEGEREEGRDRDKDGERGRGREGDRQTDRQRERERERERELEARRVHGRGAGLSEALWRATDATRVSQR